MVVYLMHQNSILNLLTILFSNIKNIKINSKCNMKPPHQKSFHTII